MQSLACWGEWFIRRSVLNVRTKGTWLVISGRTGTGKTHVGRICHRFFNDYAGDVYAAGRWNGRGLPSAAWLHWPGIVRQTDSKEAEQVLGDAEASQVIIIDDLGAETDRFKNGSSTSLAGEFLEHCEKKFVLITTNILKTDWANKFDARVADRLDSAHHFDTSDIPSYRPKLKG